MRVFITSLLIAIITALLLPTPIYAEENYVAKVTTLAKESVHDGDYFAASEVVEIYGTVNGDVYVAGSEILIDGTINGDLLVIGGAVNISGDINQDVRAIGGQVDINATIGRNLSVVAADVTIDDDTTIAGNLVFASGNATINAPLPNDVTAASGNITFYAPIDGSVTVAVEKLRFTESSEVAGDLTYWSSTEAQGTDRVRGNVKMNKIETPEIKDDSKNESEKISLRSIMFTFASNVLIGIIFVKLLPEFSRGSSEIVRTKTLVSFVYGLAILFLAPIFIIILLISVVGLPLSLITLSVYLTAMYVAKIFVALWLGRLVINRFEATKSDVWAVTTGVLLYAIFGTLPYVGLWVKFLAMTLGLGAILLNLKTYLIRNRIDS